MRSPPSKCYGLRLCIAVVAIIVPAGVMAQTLFPVFPPGHSMTDGNSFSTIPFTASSNTVRFQQVYSADGFIAQAGNVPYLIRSVAFRMDAGRPAFGSTFPDFHLTISTTSRGIDGLSTSFADNVGADVMDIFPRGAFSYAGDPSGSGGFSSILLPTPFYYDPSQGNLLLDFRNFGGEARSMGNRHSSALRTLMPPMF